MSSRYKQQALDYHAGPKPGKIGTQITKPCITQHDLSLAYTPGVAQPCLEIARDHGAVYDYTSKGNLVAVVSNGTAVLGLGWRAKLRRPRFLLGCVLFGTAPVLTYLAARHLDFSIIFAATALNFPFVMILARVFLGEPLDRSKVAAVCGIVLGLALFVL